MCIEWLYHCKGKNEFRKQCKLISLKCLTKVKVAADKN